MAIFKLNIKRLFKNKGNHFFIFWMPIISILVASIFVIGPKEKIKLGIVANDDFTTKMVVKDLENYCGITKINKDAIKYNLIFNNLDCVVVFDENLSSKILKGQKPLIKIYTFSKTEYYVFIKEQINNLINIFSKISAKCKNIDDFKEKANNYLKVPINIESESISNNRKQISLQLGLGFLVISLMSLSINAASILLKDKEEKTLLRILCSNIKPKNYILQSILSICAVVICQVLIYIGLVKIIYKDSFTKNLASSLFIFSLCAFLFVSLALLVIAFIRNSNQLGVVMPILATVLPMLGGCYWPVEIMPKFMQKLSLFMPTTYVMNAARNVVILGKPVLSVKNDLLIIILFSILFILISARGLSKNLLEKM